MSCRVSIYVDVVTFEGENSCVVALTEQQLVSRVDQVSKTGLQDPLPWGGPGTLGEALLSPTTIYVSTIISLMEAVDIKVRSPFARGALLVAAPAP